MTKVIYLQERKPGLHCYTPEMGQRTPNIEMTANIGFYGDYYINTGRELKGRGIRYIDSFNGKNRYKVTKLAFNKLKEQYPIKMECFLD